LARPLRALLRRTVAQFATAAATSSLLPHGEPR